MAIFSPENRNLSTEHQRIYALYEVWYTAVDFTACFLFTTGSALFFWKATESWALWCFLVGSPFFMLKPTIRLLRELKYVEMGRWQTLAERDRQRG